LLPQKEKLEEIVKSLAKIMRVQDWDIDLSLITKLEMQEESGSKNDVACCMRNRKLKYAMISLNTDHVQIKEDWYQAIIHEMYHIITDDWHYHATGILDFVKDESTNTNLDNTMNVYYERTMEILAKGFVNAYPVTNFIKEGNNDAKEINFQI